MSALDYLMHLLFRMPRFSYFLLAVSLAYSSLTRGHAARLTERWEEDVIYFMMTDRFFDGDPANNVPAGADAVLYDPQQADINRFHGGDFRGVELAILDGYFNDLGVTAIWITPPVKNAWFSIYDDPGSKTGYHGYWAQDFLDIDPRLTSAMRLDGSAYPEGRDGRMEHYRDLVALANRNGIKMVQDIVCNHIGPLFYYDFDGNGDHELSRREWLPAYKPSGGYMNAARWADEPAWNTVKLSGPAGGDVVLGKELDTSGILQGLDVYWGKGFNHDSLGKRDGEEMFADFFALRAINTDPNAPHFDALVDEFVEIYRFYIQELGVDGLRVDTVKHVHKEFWDAFSMRLRQQLGADAERFFMFGEVFGNTLEDINFYGITEDRSDLCLESLLNFQFTWAVRDAFRKGGSYEPEPLANFIGRMNAEIGETNLYSAAELRQRQVNFIGNHDGPNRFLVRGVEDEAHFLALAFMLTMEGIPCIYYGSELAARDEAVGWDVYSETGRFTLFNVAGKRVFTERHENETFQRISQLIRLRADLPALVDGPVSLIERGDLGDGIIAFQRGAGGDAALVLLNTSKTSRIVDLSDEFAGEALLLRYSNGTLERQATRLGRLIVPPLTIQVYTMPAE